MLKNAPFRSPNKPIVTQEYACTDFLLWYHQNNVNIPYHNGIDIVFGNSWQTMGTECICPFETAKVVKVTPKPLDPISTKGNGVTIQGMAGSVMYQVVFWHTCEIKVELNQTIKKGDIICYIGNSGLCNPKRNILAPANGSHCHLGLFKYNWDGLNWNLQNANNGVGGAINPRELFDFSQWELGEDTGLAHDMFVLKDYINWMTGDTLVKYFKFLKL